MSTTISSTVVLELSDSLEVTAHTSHDEGRWSFDVRSTTDLFPTDQLYLRGTSIELRRLAGLLLTAADEADTEDTADQIRTDGELAAEDHLAEVA